MALINALQFVKNVARDSDLRSRCYEAESRQELLELLEFNDAEFENAINMNLLKCQTDDEAYRVKELKLWFFML